MGSREVGGWGGAYPAECGLGMGARRNSYAGSLRGGLWGRIEIRGPSTLPALGGIPGFQRESFIPSGGHFLLPSFGLVRQC